ncbi:hypothetical protein BJ741DRAFT_587882, partial [Chytriomyces cf. hyalinus JEL632]
MKTALLLAVAVQTWVGVAAVIPVWTYYQDDKCQTAVVRAKSRPDEANCEAFECRRLVNSGNVITGKYVSQICSNDPIGAARAAFSPYAEVIEEIQHNDGNCADPNQGFAM